MEKINQNIRIFLEKYKNCTNIFYLYLLFCTVYYLFYYIEAFPIKFVYTDWLINYEGGFVRRGLLGQLLLIISEKFKYY